MREVVRAAAVDQRVLVDPADAGGIRPKGWLGTGRQPALHLAQVLQHPRARPVQIGAVLEQYVHEAIAEERIAAHRLCPRHREHGGGQRVGHLIFDDLWRLSRVGGTDDHLYVGQIR